MAGNLEDSLLEKVHETIEKFPSSLDDDDSTDEADIEETPMKKIKLLGGGRFMEHKNAQTQETTPRGQIEQLKMEIAMLEDELISSQQQLPNINNEQLENIIKHLLNSKRKISQRQKHNAEEMTKDISQLKVQLELLETFTGVHMESTSCQITKIETTAVERRHRLRGSCSRRPFELDFTVTETRVKEESTAKVTELSIYVNKSTQSDLENILVRFEEECDVQGFFRVFVPYAEINCNRHRTFTHFQQKYAPNITLPHGPGGTYMQLFNKKKPGAIWTFDWQIGVTPSGKVYPDLQLTVKAPQKMFELDKGHTLEAAPEKFQKMLQLLGTIRAIECIVHIVLD